MIKKNFIYRIFLLVLITQFHSLNSQTEKEYNDGHGKKIKIPLGDRAFADSLISYKPGNPAPLYEKCKNGMLAIGPPDFDGVDNNFTVLGSGGEIVLFFKDNALINIPGIDLYVFELGKYIEETYLSISTDGKKWINVGKISGGNAAVDLGDNIPENEIYRFIKLKDFSKLQDKNESYPGADIDAVAAIGSAKAISLNSSVLFNYSDANLKKEAFPSLDSIAEYLNKNPDYLIKVQGHCDSTGNNSFNKQLSINRANAVKKYLVSKTKNKSLNFVAEGYSSEIPISSNSTENGRKKNRRVDIFLIPSNQQKKQSAK